MSAGKVQWTPEQKQGIETTGRSLLISAAAGSGKTAVLSARCAYLVCEAAQPCDVDELLVVTFTEAAAAQMKARIEQALRKKLANTSDPRLERQLALVERTQVSTLHGFCSRLLRQNFHLLGLDPAFEMLDGDEQTLMRHDVIRELLGERFENDADGLFAKFVDGYGHGSEVDLIPHILRTHDVLCSLEDPGAWINRTLSRIDEAAGDGPLETTQMGRELLAMLERKIAATQARATEAAVGLSRQKDLAVYSKYLHALAQSVGEWGDLLRTGGLDALAAVMVEFKLPKKPTLKGEAAGKEAASELIKLIQAQIKAGDVVEMARFSAAQWQAGMRQIAPMARLYLNLVMDFARRYRKTKDQSRRLDFNDLERFALRILRDSNAPGRAPSGVARACHRQYQHVLVDEYQDINQVQDAILSLVSRECLGGQSGVISNLFCVGDVKQSIYRFRLAEPQRFLERYARYKSAQGAGDSAAGQVIDLQANFRSRGPLLEAINAVFTRLMRAEGAEIEYDDSHALKPGAKYPQAVSHGFAGAPIELHLLPDEIVLEEAEGGEDWSTTGESEEVGQKELDRSEREAAFVARRIRAIMGLDGSPRMQVTERSGEEWKSRPVRFRDIVILLRSMKVKGDQYADVLRSAGIPVFREGGRGYFQSMEVRDIRSLLQLLDNQQQDIPMAAVLRSPLAGLAQPEDCLARIRLGYPRDVPFHQAVLKYATDRSDELAASLRDFLVELARWRELARHRPLAELIWEIYDQTGYLAFCQGLADGEQRVANLIELHERAGQFGTFSRQGLYRFLTFLDSLEAQTDFGQPSVLSEAADVVRIMSVHHSKGLEFPVVFVPEMGKRFNLQDTTGAIVLDRVTGLGLHVVDEQKRVRYPSLASMLVKESIRRQSLAEELRILYVAMTRAMEHLILSGTCSPRRIEQWRNIWGGRSGAMPAAEVQRAGTTLDWLGPVWAMSGDGTAMAMSPHTVAEVAEWSGAALERPVFTPLQEKLARLAPMQPAPIEDARAAAVIDRLLASYPHAALARVEAARSVTEWTKRGRQTQAGYVAPAGAEQTTPIRFDRTLVMPRCMLSADQMTAADIGEAMHLVLQHLDLAKACTGADLSAQLERMVQQRLIAAGQAKVVDLSAVEWFIQTPLGRQLCDAHDRVRRELAFYYTVDAKEFGPAAGIDRRDRVMIRGRIDAMIVEAGGLTVIDYKTDHVDPSQLSQRVDFYRPQVDLYRRAMSAITGRTVNAVYLVFLTPRQVVTV